MTNKRIVACIFFCTTASLVAAVRAQTAEVTQEAQGGGQSASTTSQSANPAATTSLDEIIVTAQKRSERIQDVPITITAVDSGTLEKAGVQSIGALSQVVPALRVDNAGVYSQPSIRGVGSSVSGVATGSAVGIYIDGFFQPSPLTSDFDLLNVSSIQVLKGPQGTLFGRNTTAGAILVTTSDPSFATKLAGKLSYSRFNTFDGQFYGSTGITDALAIDIAGLYRRGDGFIHNIVTGRHDGQYENSSFRTGLKFDLDESGNNSLLLRYAHTDTDDPTFAAQTVYQRQSIGSLIPGTVVASRRGEVSNNDSSFKSKTDAGYLTGRFDLSSVQLKSYTMYRNESAHEVVDFDGTQLPIFLANFRSLDRTFTQEIDLNSKPGSWLDWVIGAYYYRERGQWPNFQVSVFGSPATELWKTSNTVTSYAVFGDATYRAGEHLYLTAGVRYSHEHDDGYYNLLQPDAQTGQTAGFYPAAGSWKNTTPRAVIRYELDPSSSFYASYSKGYKAGFVNSNGLTQVPVEPEKITAVEIGYKYARGPTRLSVSAFHYDYSDLQVAIYNGTLAIVTNAAKSSLYGAELELNTKLTDHFNLSLGGAYTHSKYDQYPNAPRFDQILDPTNPAFGTFGTTAVNASGNVMQRAPKFSGDINLDYVTALASGSVDLNVNSAWQSRFYFDPANQFPQSGYGLLNLRATWTAPSGHWSLSVFGNNVTDRTYAREVFPTPFALLQVYGEPVTYGVSASFNF